MNSNSIPTFSVVVPVYNKEPHVSRAISSCLQQTYPNFELLVIDDASTDNSLGKLSEFDDPRIRILRRSTPGPGGYAARNLGISEARGKWIAFLDADDEWMPSHLSDLHALSLKFPDCDFLTCGWKTFNPDSSCRENQYFLKNVSRGAHTLSFVDYLRACLTDMRPTHTSVACIRNSDFAEELFPAGRAYRGGDLHAWLSYLARSDDMAWSPTVGGIYYLDTVNQVTKSASGSAALALGVIDELEPYLTAAEMALLRKYSNRRIYRCWRAQKSQSEVALTLASSLNWSGDFYFCLTRSCLSIIPIPLLMRLSRLRHVLGSSSAT